MFTRVIQGSIPIDAAIKDLNCFLPNFNQQTSTFMSILSLFRFPQRRKQNTGVKEEHIKIGQKDYMKSQYVLANL